CYFFFQAEDGIRDFHVTGVQTCALPILAVLFLAAVTYYVLNYFYKLQPAVLYFLLLVIGPLALFCIKIYQAKSKTHYKNLSRLLKLIMLMGILSLLLYKYVLLN